MSETLQTFYNALQNWIDIAFYGELFHKHLGICACLENYLDDQYGFIDWNFLDELKSQFEHAGLDETYPFNDIESFGYEVHNDTIFENSARLKWIKEHANLT